MTKATETIEECTDPNLLKSTPKRPLVTFAVLAYNQEKYIREAVESAFSQNYSPLEIILSDDCSCDRTFEMMNEMAAAYTGQNLVLVRRNEKNLRPYSHVLEITKWAKGDIVVLAAGDDISKPNRTTEIVRASQATDAWAFHSRFDVVDELGCVLSTSQRSEALFAHDNEFSKYFMKSDGHVFVVHGATSAYKRELISIAPADDSGILSEDGVFSILLNMKRKSAVFLEDSLVMYRAHSEAISNVRFDSSNLAVASCQKLLERQALYAKNIADRASLALNFSINSVDDLRPLDERYLRDEIILQRAVCDWRQLHVVDRLRAVRIAIDRQCIGYLLPSILGRKFGPLFILFRHKLKK